MNNILVLGGGPAGLLAATMAAQNGAEATLLERNDLCAKKLRITGKGRCNLTNTTNALEELVASVPQGGRFLFGAFQRFLPNDTMELFERLGVPLKVERGGRVFPVSDNAHDVAEALLRYTKDHGVKILHQKVQKIIINQGKFTGVITETGEEFLAEAGILATGGASYPQTGSDGSGYALAKEAGHKIVPLRPSLVPLECHEGFCSRLMGLTLKNTALEVFDRVTERVVFRDLGELLFTHFGVSGPMALSASAHMRDMTPERYELRLDLKPGLRPEQLDARLLRDFQEHSGKNFMNVLNQLLPKRLVPVMVGLSEIPAGQRVGQVTREERRSFAALLKRFCLTVTGFRPIEEAIVTSGGVDLKEVAPNRMESRCCAGLFFAGEVLDVDAYTGGYNLQIAFSTGHLAGCSAAEYVKNLKKLEQIHS